jgi:hypothetical protein
VVGLIKEQKATMIVVEHISYNVVAGTYDSDIFTPIVAAPCSW